MKPVVLISGISGGIGRETARLFNSNGWKVIGISRKDLNPIQYFADFVIKADISKGSEIEKIIASLKETADRIDVLVNNAAIQIIKPILETTDSDWDLTLDTNLKAPFLLAKGVYPWLKETKGSIVNICSVHAVATSSSISAYAASKGGLMALTRAMAIEFAQDKIRVNAVLPGAIDTDMLHSGLLRGIHQENELYKRFEDLKKKHLFGDVGRPYEIAQVIYFLSDNSKSSFITGQGIIADGGVTARLSSE
jgi:glucose 1-dehydrogenase